MKFLNKPAISDKISGLYLFIMRYMLSAFAIFLLAFMLLRFPSYSADGVKKGISLCLESLVPSLYPFMIVTDIFISSKAAEIRSVTVGRLCKFLFRLPASAMPVILLSFIGGLPVGAKMSAELYERGLISKEQCARMLCFCINPGPAFVISAVGVSMLGSQSAGLIIYISLVLSSFIIGVASRFFVSPDENLFIAEKSICNESQTGNMIEKSVIRSSKAVLAVCSWVVAFSCLGELISVFALGEGMKSFLLCISEMTRGCFTAAGRYPVPIVAAVIGFSGICGHFQIMGEMKKCFLKYKTFLVCRIINSGLSAVICGFLLKLFPVASETFSVGVKPDSATTSGSVMLSVLMIVMAILFVLGDDYRVTGKKQKKF